MSSVLCHEQPPIIGCLRLHLTPYMNISRSFIERRNVMDSITDTAMDKLFATHICAAPSEVKPRRSPGRGISSKRGYPYQLHC